MKICDICKQEVDILYPLSFYIRGEDEDICIDCINSLKQSGCLPKQSS